MTVVPLVTRLRGCADLWVVDREASLAMLGRLVINDGGYFNRIEETGSTTTATLEKFARFLADPAHWPEGHGVPAEVRAFAHVVGVGVAAAPSDHAPSDRAATASVPVVAAAGSPGAGAGADSARGEIAVPGGDLLAMLDGGHGSTDSGGGRRDHG